jgi:hypothetical protein
MARTPRSLFKEPHGVSFSGQLESAEILQKCIDLIVVEIRLTAIAQQLAESLTYAAAAQRDRRPAGIDVP